jgi:hypothetical protein
VIANDGQPYQNSYAGFMKLRDGKAIDGAAFYDSISFNDLWTRVEPRSWGPHDGYMTEGSARPYLRDLPDAELHLLDGGHWALETKLDEIVALSGDFRGRVHG